MGRLNRPSDWNQPVPQTMRSSMIEFIIIMIAGTIIALVSYVGYQTIVHVPMLGYCLVIGFILAFLNQMKKWILG